MLSKTKFKLRLVAAILALAAAYVPFRLHAKAVASDEIDRLATLMDWKPGSVVADIGAGDGRYAFAAATHVGAEGKVFATEIDQEKLTALRDDVQKRHLQNVVILESKDADTNLPEACCDAIFLRRVYHHLTRPSEFNAALLRSLKPGGRLAIIDFAPRSGLPKVEGVPPNRGGHGIPQKIAIEELTAAGFQLSKSVDDWPEGDYCLLFLKK
jgi:ubiquinone/menaquinone biosynthesis C-methylase UbiE